MLILIHTCVLHSYLNMVSELTQFADRDFYHVSLVVLFACIPLTLHVLYCRTGGRVHHSQNTIANGTL